VNPTIDKFLGMKSQDLVPFIVIALFFAAIAASTTPMTAGNVLMWGTFIILGIIAIYMAFPHTRFYGIWLLSVYILIGVGVVFINGIGLSGVQGVIVGLILEVLAFYIAYNLVMQVKGLRDISDGAYIPLGLWSLCVVLFVIFTNVAAQGFVTSVKGGEGVTIYVSAEVVMAVIAVYILKKPESVIIPFEMEVAPADVRPAVARRKTRQGAKKPVVDSTGVLGARREVARACPVCKKDLEMRERTCPSCGSDTQIGYCTYTGHIIIPCPSCGEGVTYGAYRCKSCGAKVGENLFCTNCGKESELKEWSKPGSA
jgi:hypothetical protein